MPSAKMFVSRTRQAGGILSLFVLAFALASCADGAPVSPDLETLEAPGNSGLSLVQDVDYVPGRVLVRFTPGAAAENISRGAGGEMGRGLGLGYRIINVPEGAEQRVIAALSRNPNVEVAELDLLRTFGDPDVIPVNDPFIGYKWDLDNDGRIYSSTGVPGVFTGKADADMDWPEAMAALEAAGVVIGSAKIGILDTGIRADHEELVGRTSAQYNFIEGNDNAADDHGHGTHVAGIAAAATDNGKGVAGVAFGGDIQFVVGKVCGEIGRGRLKSYGCPSSAVAEGIQWAVDQGAAVLNLSLGGTVASDLEEDALGYARENGVLPFCATGNENGPVSYPAAFTDCVAVAATDWSDNRASYSNWGEEVELAAPGGDDEDPNGYSYILSSYFDDPDSYVFMAGTSMATPQAVGLGGLLHALGVEDDDEKLALMKSTADNLGPAEFFGAGRINIAAAVEGQGGGEPPPPPPPPPNVSPTADFSFTSEYLTASFTDASSDSDGSVVSRSWTFGDGGTSTTQNPTHTYSSGGTYTVTLTVWDDDGATDARSQDVTVTAPEPPGGIVLTARNYKVRAEKFVELTWAGTSASAMDIVRNGSTIATESNTGSFTDSLGKAKGTYTYKVCEAGTSTCSNEVVVSL